MRRVDSRNENDCGVCALATWAGVGYGVADGLLFPKVPEEGDRGSLAEQMGNAIRRLGVNTRVRRTKLWSSVPNGSMVTVRHNRGYHWVVKGLNGRLIDSYYTKRSTPPPSYEVVSYLEVDDGKPVHGRHSAEGREGNALRGRPWRQE